METTEHRFNMRGHGQHYIFAPRSPDDLNPDWQSLWRSASSNNRTRPTGDAVNLRIGKRAALSFFLRRAMRECNMCINGT